MQNTMQKVTKNGRPIINRSTKTPVYRRSLHSRVKHITNELYKGLTPNEVKWQLIKNSVATLQLST